MISFFNQLGNSWFAKTIFFLLGISMLAFWGLGGISNTTQSDLTALTVGDEDVPIQVLGRTFDQEREKMSQISGGYITPKRALEAGLLEQVVQQLAIKQLNLKIQQEMGLAASDEAVRRYIEKNPVFLDQLGKFDVNLFTAYLSGMKMSQAEFAHQMRSELANQHLTRTLVRVVPRDPALMKRAAQAKKEKRSVEAVLLTPEKKREGEPDSEQLKEYYEAYMEDFALPEYRSVRMVSLTPQDFKNDYEALSKKARDLEDLLGAGQGLKEACETLKIKTGHVVVMDFSGKDKKGQEVKEVQPLLQEVFALSEGEATSLIDVEGGYLVAGVEKITPRSYRDFNSVREEVLSLWHQEQQKAAMKKQAEELWTSLQQGKGWQRYTPKTYLVSQTEDAVFPKGVVPVLLQQPIGRAHAQVFPTDQGIWVISVKEIVPSHSEPTASEQQEAVQDWSLDLVGAVQQFYADRYPITVHTNTIQKAFSVYEKQED